MKLVWRKTNSINRTSLSIVNECNLLRDSKIGATLHSSRWLLDASHQCLSSGLCKPGRAAGRKRNQDARAKRNSRVLCFAAIEVAVESSPVPA